LLCLAGSVQLRSSGGEQFFSYDYSRHGADWVQGSCSSKARQSPIDLPTVAQLAGAFQYKYKPITKPFDVMNNGHALAADMAGLGFGGLTYEGAWYDLMNINVHASSEHAWAGVRKPLELHMVHKHFASEQMLVVAIAVESKNPPAPTSFAQYNTSLRQASKQVPSSAPAPAGANAYAEPPATDADFNPTLQTFLKQVPPSPNMKVAVPASQDKPLDFDAFLAGDSTFYEYAGSTTAPPCAEIVTWLVRKDPLKASDKQVSYLHDAIYKTTADFGNFRSLQPLNGRAVTMRKGRPEDPPRTTGVEIEPRDMGVSDREMKTMKMSMDAMNIAKSATDYIKDVDARLRNAAEAHAEALAPMLEPLGPNKAQSGPGVPLNGGVMPPTDYVAGQIGDVKMEDAAKTMTNHLKKFAAKEVADAVTQISTKSKAGAIKAAAEAAAMVNSGQGVDAGPAAGVSTMANNVATPPGTV